jgi:hypothetical protein
MTADPRAVLQSAATSHGATPTTLSAGPGRASHTQIDVRHPRDLHLRDDRATRPVEMSTKITAYQA